MPVSGTWIEDDRLDPLHVDGTSLIVVTFPEIGSHLVNLRWMQGQVLGIMFAVFGELVIETHLKATIFKAPVPRAMHL